MCCRFLSQYVKTGSALLSSPFNTFQDDQCSRCLSVKLNQNAFEHT